MNYAKAFRIIRVAYGLSQVQLAELLSVGASQVSLIESGRRQPSLRTIGELSKVLRIPRSLVDLLASETHELDQQDPALVAMLANNLLRLLVEARSEGPQHAFKFGR